MQAHITYHTNVHCFDDACRVILDRLWEGLFIEFILHWSDEYLSLKAPPQNHGAQSIFVSLGEK